MRTTFLLVDLTTVPCLPQALLFSRTRMGFKFQIAKKIGVKIL